MKVIVKVVQNFIGNAQASMLARIQSAISKKQNKILIPIFWNLKET